jgi:neurobeachin-like protein 1/2
LHQYRPESSSHSVSGIDDIDEMNEEDDEDDPNHNDFIFDERQVTNPYEKQSSQVFHDTYPSSEEPILFATPCEVITPATNSTNFPSAGQLLLTRTKLIFNRATDSASVRSSFTTLMCRPRKEDSIACESLYAYQPFPSTQWDVSDICNVLRRYYQLRLVAVEIFTTSRRVYFLNLLDTSKASRFIKILRERVRPPYLAPSLGSKPSMIIQKSLAPNSMQLLTDAWANREISNFDYLMRLNTIAGRTYNDLGQYPIFPWIVADYTSETLDLRNKTTFRDLRWPIGAQDEKQRQLLKSKYHELLQNYNPNDEGSLPPFHYGTHYSVAGFVLWYLMRVEPYTSLHIQLQDGRIDRADRLFDSLGAAWKGCISNPSDAKELIPELFYNPDIFVNINNIDFGKTQGNRQIHNIVLPTWAKDPHDFVYKHREALESEYVSRNLHHWIDLIFGYKQRPPHLPRGNDAAVDACNVFFHLTYEDAIDLEKLKESNSDLYCQSVCQITEFGQTPAQLFFREHVARIPLHKVDIIWPIASIVRGVHTIYDEEESIGMPRKMLCFKNCKISNGPIVFIVDSEDKLLTLDHSRTLGIHTWQVLSHDAVPPFRLRVDPILAEIHKM